jgi:chromate transporter
MSLLALNKHGYNKLPVDGLSDMTADKDTVPSTSEVSLWFLFWTFLKIGSVAFGGFMALISVIESAIVRHRKLMHHQDMLDGISLANLLPGPMAVNVVAFVGYRLRGPAGALVSATAVILPSFMLLLVLSHLYFLYGEVAGMQNVFRGFMPAVAAVVLSVAWRMGRKTVSGWAELLLVVSAAVILALAPQSIKIYAPPAIIACLALIGYYLFKQNTETNATADVSDEFSMRKLVLVIGLLAALVLLWFFPLPLPRDSLVLLTLTFASMSLMLFGGGYVFIPIIGSIVVLDYGWVSQQEFMDGIAMGQITPGPILISATFIGYKVAGWLGALCATVAIFTPPAILMVTASQALSRIRHSAAVQAAMHGIHCGVIGMILVAAIVILKTTVPAGLTDGPSVSLTAGIFAASLLALMRFNLDVIWVIAISGVLGYFLY